MQSLRKIGLMSRTLCEVINQFWKFEILQGNVCWWATYTFDFYIWIFKMKGCKIPMKFAKISNNKYQYRYTTSPWLDTWPSICTLFLMRVYRLHTWPGTFTVFMLSPWLVTWLNDSYFLTPDQSRDVLAFNRSYFSS
jgi:hypothetical protein